MLKKITIATLIINLLTFPLTSYNKSRAQELPDKNAIIQSIQAPQTPQDLPQKDKLKETISNDAQQQVIQSQQEAQGSQNSQPANTNPSSQTTNTGDNNTTTSSSSDSTQSGVNNNNNAVVNQNANGTAITGENITERNISINGSGAGIIITGDATVSTNAVINANGNNTTILYPDGSSSSNSSVTNTGNNVKTINSSNSSLTILVNNNNNTIINQAAFQNAMTGGNDASRNIALNGGAAGVIITGDALSSTNFLVTANGSVTIIGGQSENGGPGSHASIIITNTGSHNRFSALNQLHNYILVNNENRALINQVCGSNLKQKDIIVNASTCSAVTGYNTSNGNINKNGDAGVIYTADATVNVALNADVNSNTTSVKQNSKGSSTNSDVVNTGDNNTFVSNSNNTNNALVNNTNNAVINQNVNAIAVSGRNEASRNISYGGVAGFIHTGNATVNILMVANLNNNDTQISQGSATLQDLSDPGNSLSVTNTGDNNVFTNSQNNTSNTIINNNNTAVINQHVLAQATSGNNTVDRNIGNQAGIVRTGTATVLVNAEINANNNEVNSPAVEPTPTIIPQPTEYPQPTQPIISPQPTTTPPIGGNGEEPTPSDDKPTTVNGISSTSSSSSSGDGSTGGTVLAAAVNGATKGKIKGIKKLPSTGVQNVVLIWAILTIAHFVGKKIKKYTYAQSY